ncbi:UPF0187-domain-containing protein [Fistulina hepatica ATCC 64428]|nr:UPF0187-domain-containing protein [Fistulina hepatica ATCC 64428]
MSISQDDAMKGSLGSIIPNLKAPRIKRKHLRKYSWLPDFFRIKNTIIPRIVGPVLTFTIFSGLVSFAWTRGIQYQLTNSVVPLLSVVVGLALVFSTSYDRFWEGRKSFATMSAHIRNLSRLVWINVTPPPVEEQKGKVPIAITSMQLRRRKIECLRLCLAFAFAVKHHLRGEDGTEWEDYRGVLPEYVVRLGFGGTPETQRTSTSMSYSATRSNSSEALSSLGISGSSVLAGGNAKLANATKRVRVKRSKGELGVRQPLLSESHHTVNFASYSEDVSTPLPLIIAHEITRHLFLFRRDGLLETIGPAGMNAMNQLVQAMVDDLTAMERVANTPIPPSFGIHLKQCITLYLFALPLTLIKEVGWACIPLVTVVAFTLVGVEGIADETEMPFGRCDDTNDLPLDRYCQDLKEEVFYTIQRLPEGGVGLQEYDDGAGDD